MGRLFPVWSVLAGLLLIIRCCYIFPPLVGVGALTAHQVSGAGAVQVFFATIGGVWAYRKSGFLNKSLILYMGSNILIGSMLEATAHII